MVLPLTTLFSAANIAEYWNNSPQAEEPYLGAELFPAEKQLGMEMEWVKGAGGAPVALRMSALDVEAIPRPFNGFSREQQDMAYYKESWYIDEKTRQQILLLMSGNNQAYMDMISKHVYNQPIGLIAGAKASSEIARMQALTTGQIHITGNGDAYDIDYGIPDAHKQPAVAGWGDADKAQPLTDFREIKTAMAAQGTTISRVIMNQATFNKLTATRQIQDRLKPAGAGNNYPVLDSEVIKFIQTNLGLEIAVYDKIYKEPGTGITKKFIDDDVAVFVPATTLGRTGYGTTPAEADLMAGQANVTNVSIVESGIAVLNTIESDPVKVGGIVSQMSMPSFEQANNVFILDTSVVETAPEEPSGEKEEVKAEVEPESEVKVAAKKSTKKSAK